MDNQKVISIRTWLPKQTPIENLIEKFFEKEKNYAQSLEIKARLTMFEYLLIIHLVNTK